MDSTVGDPEYIFDLSRRIEIHDAKTNTLVEPLRTTLTATTPGVLNRGVNRNITEQDHRKKFNYTHQIYL